MNSLQVDPATGFLDADNTNAFGAAKKVKFLELCQEFKNQNTFPKVSVICDAIGVNITTFERHLANDQAFRQAWQEIATHVEYQCINDMHELRKKNPMYMFGFLRYLNPSRWNPNINQGNTGVNVSIFVDNLKDREKPIDTQAVDVEVSTPPMVDK